MVKTVVSLDDDDKRWLDERARSEGLPMTELVRRAVRLYREAVEQPSFAELVRSVRGTWKHGDGLRWQMALREEWDERDS